MWIAFADDVLLLERNSIEHRVGLGRLSRANGYRDATIGGLIHWGHWGRPFGRVYVVTADGRRLLFVRNADHAVAVADFLCSMTEWQRRDFPMRTASQYAVVAHAGAVSRTDAVGVMVCS